MQIGESVPARVSRLELAKLRFPGAAVTSGAAQDYLRRLDLKLAKGAKLERGFSTWRVLDKDETECFTMTEAEARRVVLNFPEL